MNYSIANGSDTLPTTGKGWKSAAGGGGTCIYPCRIQYCVELKFDRHHYFIIVICV